MTSSGCISCVTSVREIASGLRTTLDTVSPQTQAMTTWPNSWMIIIQSQERARVKAMEHSWKHRPSMVCECAFVSMTMPHDMMRMSAQILARDRSSLRGGLQPAES